MRGRVKSLAEARRRLRRKIDAFDRHADWGFKVADFGLRRRYSGPWQEEVVREFADRGHRIFSGTSNVYLAKKFGVSPIGTFAHELFMGVMGTDVRVSEVQRRTLDMWAHEYRGELGIGLSDIFGFRAFLRDFENFASTRARRPRAGATASTRGARSPSRGASTTASRSPSASERTSPTTWASSRSRS